MANWTNLGRIRPVPQGVWSADREYKLLDVATTGNGMGCYIAKKAVPAGTPLTDGAYWMPMLDADIVAAIADRAQEAAVVAENTSDTKANALTAAFDGNTAVLYPDEGSTIRASSDLIFAQSGSGDPSPENIRPITGKTGAKLTLCGKNMFSTENLVASFSGKIGWETNGDTVRVYTTEAVTRGGVRPNYRIPLQARKTYTFSANVDSIASGTAGIGLRDAATMNYITRREATAPGRISRVYTPTEDVEVYPYILCTSATAADGDATFSEIQFEVSEAATEYEAYRGVPYEVSFGERTVYGGTLNWDTGVLTIDKGLLVMDGTNSLFVTKSSVTNVDRYLRGNSYIAPNSKLICSHAYEKAASPTLFTVFAGDTGTLNFNFAQAGTTTVDDVNNWLREQYDAGTPFQVVYELRNPFSVQLSPVHIAALAGINTVYTDTISLSGAYNKSFVRELDEVRSEIAAVTDAYPGPVKSAWEQRMLERIDLAMKPVTVLRKMAKAPSGYFYEGDVINGIVYSALNDEKRRVGTDVPLRTYYSALENPASVMYTQDEYQDQTGKSTYYGVNCSGFVCFAYGWQKFTSTDTMADRYRDNVLDIATEDDLFQIRRGDLILNTIEEGDEGEHVKLVKDVVYDRATGKLVGFNVAESGKPIVRVRFMTPATFLEQMYEERPYYVARIPDEDYTLIMPDMHYSKSVYPDRGDGGKYASGDEVWLYIPVEATSVEYSVDGGTPVALALSSMTSAVVNEVTVYRLPVTAAGTYSIHADTAPDDGCTIVIE